MTEQASALDKVHEIENLFITMPDGTRLAARVWLPADALQHPVPAILEYIPYRKRDITRARDALTHPWLAAHGYACVRVDMRGSGDSEGVLTDEYTRQEKDDAVAVIHWLAEQRWCDGNVGMMGISWGGFNSLMVAAEAPAPLQAIITVCSSDDVYADNMHYMGGCLLGDNLSEATVMFAFNSLPPDPRIVGEDRWRDLWQQRLAGSGLWLEKWLRHQRRTDYWKTNSVCENYSAVTCPVYAIGGWADGYTNTIFRLLQHLQVPRKGLIGPWGHKYPHEGVPGPAIGFLQECLRWWDHWLKDIDTGIMDEPMLRAWQQDSVPPDTSYEDRPGRWIAETGWPGAGLQPQHWQLAPHQLLPITNAHPRTEEGTVLSVSSPTSVGMFAGKWCSYAATPDLPGDQREEDGGALVFQSAPLTRGLAILGQPRITLDIAADAPRAMLAVRLSDVAPNGEATRVTYGLLNLCHRDSHEQPTLLEPFRYYRVSLNLNGIAQHFPAGHRLRLSVSSSYWPLAWPSPTATRLMINTGGCELVLPQRPAQPQDASLAPFAAPESAPPLATTRRLPGEHAWRVIRDLADNSSTLEVINDQGCFHITETDTAVRRATREWYRIRHNDVLSAEGETFTEREFHREDWQVRVTTRTLLRCDATTFRIHAQLDAYENGNRIYSDNWDYAIPRDHL